MIPSEKELLKDISEIFFSEFGFSSPIDLNLSLNSSPRLAYDKFWGSKVIKNQREFLKKHEQLKGALSQILHAKTRDSHYQALTFAHFKIFKSQFSSQPQSFL